MDTQKQKENENVQPTAWIGFSVWNADGSGYTKRWSWPEEKYLGRIDEKVK